jgi:hypothetical protein
MKLKCCNQDCNQGRECIAREVMRPFSKVLTPQKKERLKSIVDDIREGNKKLSIFIDETDEPEMFLLTSIYEAIEDEIATLDSCTCS